MYGGIEVECRSAKSENESADIENTGSHVECSRTRIRQVCHHQFNGRLVPLARGRQSDVWYRLHTKMNITKSEERK